jgi:hypothetical protein
MQLESTVFTVQRAISVQSELGSGALMLITLGRRVPTSTSTFQPRPAPPSNAIPVHPAGQPRHQCSSRAWPVLSIKLATGFLLRHYYSVTLVPLVPTMIHPVAPSPRMIRRSVYLGTRIDSQPIRAFSQWRNQMMGKLIPRA